MYGIFTYIWLKFVINEGKYTIHGWYWALIDQDTIPYVESRTSIRNFIQKSQQDPTWAKHLRLDQQSELGGGNSNIFYVHPYLEKISNLTCAYFSDGLVKNHQSGKLTWGETHNNFLGRSRRGADVFVAVSVCVSVAGLEAW